MSERAAVVQSRPASQKLFQALLHGRAGAAACARLRRRCAWAGAGRACWVAPRRGAGWFGWPRWWVIAWQRRAVVPVRSHGTARVRCVQRASLFHLWPGAGARGERKVRGEAAGATGVHGTLFITASRWRPLWPGTSAFFCTAVWALSPAGRRGAQWPLPAFGCARQASC